jgi:hypothetical protein
MNHHREMEPDILEFSYACVHPCINQIIKVLIGSLNFFFFFLMGQGFEFWALHLQSRFSTT